jgi:hypothetical protein
MFESHAVLIEVSGVLSLDVAFSVKSRIACTPRSPWSALGRRRELFALVFSEPASYSTMFFSHYESANNTFSRSFSFKQIGLLWYPDAELLVDECLVQLGFLE